MKDRVVLAASFLALGFLGCSSVDCLNKRSLTTASPIESETPKVERVRIYKADGTLQCGTGKLIPAKEMSKSLKDIKVYNEISKNDGQMRTQVCGSPTGNVHIFEISKQDLDKALKLGFKHWVFE